MKKFLTIFVILFLSLVSVNPIYAETGTFKVERYFQNIDDDSYTLDDSKTVNDTANVGTTVNASSYKDGFNGFSFDQSNPNSILEATVDAGNTAVLKLYFKRNTYKITFYTDGGTQIAPIQAKYGATITKPEDPVKRGYVFDRWGTDYWDTNGLPDTMPAKNASYNAYYNAISYNIVYNLDGGQHDGQDHPDSASYSDNNYDYFLLRNPKKAGYQFAGWDISGMSEGEHKIGSDIVTGSTASGVTATSFHNLQDTQGATVTFKATWSPLDVTVTINAIGFENYTFNKIKVYDPDGMWGPENYYDEISRSTVSMDEIGDVNSYKPDIDGLEYEFYTFEDWGSDGYYLDIYYTRKKYKLTFNMNGGDCPFEDRCDVDSNDCDVYYGADVADYIKGATDESWGTKPVKNGYSFIEYEPNVPETMPAQNLTITAKWGKMAYYNYKFIIERGDDWSLDENGEQFTSMIIRKAGSSSFDYKLAGSKINPQDSLSYFEDGFDYEYYKRGFEATNYFGASAYEIDYEKTGNELVIPEPEENYGQVELTVYMKLKDITITFDSDGGTAINPNTITGKAAKKFTAPNNPTKEGFVFDGWQPELPAYMPATNTTYKAKWYSENVAEYKVEHYKEKLNGTYELAETDNLTGAVGTTVNATNKTYTGFNFSDSVSGTIKSGVVNEDGTLKLKLYYKRNLHKVTFKDDITILKEYSNVKYGTVLNTLQSIPAPTKQGYNFAGWDKDLTDTVPDADVVINANWTEAGDTAYKVEHYKEKLDGTYELAETQNLTGVTNATVNAQAKTYTGFTYDPSISYTVKSGTIKADGTLVLKLYYKRNSYTLTFNTNGGSIIEPITLKFGAQVTKPNNPSKTGYTFEKWNEQIPSTMPANDKTFTASYIANAYKISYDLDGGTHGASHPTSATYDKEFTINNPTKKGYNFAGWTITNMSSTAHVIEGETKTGTTLNNVTATRFKNLHDTKDATVTLKANWSARIDIPYKVEHYKEKIGGGYEKVDTKNSIGTTDSTVTAEVNTYIGFTYDSTISGTISSGKIKADGSLVLKQYYKRNSYTVVYKNGDTQDEEINKYKYGDTLTLAKSNKYTALNSKRFSYWQIGSNTYFLAEKKVIIPDDCLSEQDKKVIITAVWEDIPENNYKGTFAVEWYQATVVDTTSDLCNKSKVSISENNFNNIFDDSQIGNGIAVWVESKEADETVIKIAINDEGSITNEVKKCIEINLFAGGSASQANYISETSKAVKLSFKLDDSNLQKLAKEGKLVVYTIHNGNGKLITNCEYNDETKEFSFKTNEFSVFALVEKASSEPTPSSGGSKPKNYSIPNTSAK